MKKISQLLIALLITVLLLTGCGGGASRSSSGTGSASGSAGSKSASEVKKVEASWTGDDEEGVRDYLAAYQKLPSNYMTKTEARKRGWQGGALNQVVPGKCIGGDRYGNYEGSLPEDKSYIECDIDTLHSRSRGAKRLIYSAGSGDLDIWYTQDHYETFDLIYGDGK